MFRSFGVFNYRVWFIGALVSNVGTWMQSTAQSWVVLTVLTDGNPAAMGVTIAFQFAPPLLLVSVTGWVADRFARRTVLMVTQSTLLVFATITGVLLLTGGMTLPLMYIAAALTGLIMAFDHPARHAFVSDVVSRENSPNAVALNAASFNGARLVGPAAAGLMIVAVGPGWAFIANAATFLAMVIALAIIRPGELVLRPPAMGRRGIADGFRYVARRPDLLATFAMIFLIGGFGVNFPIFASTMALEFGQQADGFGLLSSILAVGSVIGALLTARRTSAQIGVVILASLGFGAASALSALMPSFWTYAAVTVVLGLTIVTAMTTANGYVQTTTDPALRGRVMALYVAVVMGGTPAGALVVGAMAAQYGPRVAILVAAGAGVTAFMIGAVWLVASGRVHRHATRRFALAIEDTRPHEPPYVEPIMTSRDVTGTAETGSSSSVSDDECRPRVLSTPRADKAASYSECGEPPRDASGIGIAGNAKVIE